MRKNLLGNLKNGLNKRNKVQRVGRGPGSKRGKTCCRGVKGDKSRSGYKRRAHLEGGQLPLYRKLPVRGFNNARFSGKFHSLNLGDIEAWFEEGEKVSLETVREKGLIPKSVLHGLRILGQGTLFKKVSIEAVHFTKNARQKLDEKKIVYTTVSTTRREHKKFTKKESRKD